MTDSTMVSIIISNYNGKEHLRECLRSLMGLNYPNYEVIVVDAGSKDSSTEMVERDFPSVRLIRKGRIGIGEAINLGIAIAKSEFIVFDLNNDDVVDKDWLNHLMETLCSSGEIGIVCGKRLRYGSTNVLDSAGGKINFLTYETPVVGHNREDSTEYAIQKEVDYVPVITTKREVINKIGLCDQDYFIYFEDADFCLRARRAGYKVIYVPSAIFWHKGSATLGRCTYRSYYYQRRNQIRFVLKTCPLRFIIPAILYSALFKATLDAFLTVGPIRRLFSILFPRFKTYIEGIDDPSLLAAQSAAILWNLKNIRSTLRARSVLRRSVS